MSSNKEDSKVIIALDYSNKKDTLNLVSKLDKSLCNLKVGYELFLSEGQSLIKELHKREFKIFLDLKLHDIPNTVKRAINVICDYGIWMTNVHVLGGKEMLASAKQVVKKESPETKLIGVTILTSLNDDLLKPLGFSNSVEETVYNFADLCHEAGLDGIVCSAGEAIHIRKKFLDNFLIVTPGIRLKNDTADDQKIVVTPVQAKNNGVSYIVVGRPVTMNSDPLSILKKINNEFNE